MESEKGKSINADNYVGMKTEIESAKIETMKHGAVIRVMSKEIKLKEGDELQEGKQLRASKILGLGVSETTGSLIVILESKLAKFLTSKNVEIKGDYVTGDDVKELVGLPVVIQKTDDGYLEIA